MNDLSSLELRHIRAYLSEIIELYMVAMRDKSSHMAGRLHAAQLAEKTLFNYLKLIDAAELEAELAQLRRIIADWRSTLPQPFED
jgi:hypothetical protein